MKKIFIFLALLASIGVTAQEKFQISATSGSLFVSGENVVNYNLESAYKVSGICAVGADAMLSGKTDQFDVIQKYTLFADLLLEKNDAIGLSWGMGVSYLHSAPDFDGFGVDFRSKFYTNLFSNLFFVVKLDNNISKHFNCLTQLNLGLMYRF